MREELVDNVYHFINVWNDSHFMREKPEIVLLCSPKYYLELRKDYDNQIQYTNSNYQYNIEFLNIIGLKVPVVIRKDMPKNIEYQLMFREDYERLEKEEIYKRFIEMFK